MTRTGEARLTSLSHGAGCACKLAQQELTALVGVLPASTDPDLLVGFETADDAAVYRVGEAAAIVLTADFFTPIVDDPYDFGRIAAVNALSDVYAMGATPKLAINLVAYSVRTLGAATLEAVVRGGAEVTSQAGVALAGGHSIDDPEPKYGLAVVGVVHPDEVLTNAGGQPGDAVVLTKPLGAGLVTTAAKREIATPELVAAATQVMAALNAEASQTARGAGAHAVTDVSGFGLLGHLHELCRASGLAAQITASAVPAIPGVLELARDARCVSGGTRRNAEHAQSFTSWTREVSAEQKVLLADATTSGGLLVVLPASSAHLVGGSVIGELVAGRTGEITVE